MEQHLQNILTFAEALYKSDVNAFFILLATALVGTFCTIIMILWSIRALKASRLRRQGELAMKRKKEEEDLVKRVLSDWIVEIFEDLVFLDNLDRDIAQKYYHRIATSVGLWDLIPRRINHQPPPDPDELKAQIRARLNGKSPDVEDFAQHFLTLFTSPPK